MRPAWNIRGRAPQASGDTLGESYGVKMIVPCMLYIGIE